MFSKSSVCAVVALAVSYHWGHFFSRKSDTRRSAFGTAIWAATKFNNPWGEFSRFLTSLIVLTGAALQL